MFTFKMVGGVSRMEYAYNAPASGAGRVRYCKARPGKPCHGLRLKNVCKSVVGRGGFKSTYEKTNMWFLLLLKIDCWGLEALFL